MGVGHPSEIVNLPEDDAKGGPPTSANNYGTPNTDLQMNLSPNRHIKVYADTAGGDRGHLAGPGVSPVEWWGFGAGVLADEGVAVRCRGRAIA